MGSTVERYSWLYLTLALYFELTNKVTRLIKLASLFLGVYTGTY